MFPQCCGVEGLFPQQIPAQSVQSSGGDERWGLGGNATTHFTGKSRVEPGCLLQTFVGALLLFVFLHVATHAVRGGGGRLLEEQTEVESRICVQHFQRSLNLQPRQLPRRSPVLPPLPPLPGVEDLGQYFGTFRTRH